MESRGPCFCVCFESGAESVFFLFFVTILKVVESRGKSWKVVESRDDFESRGIKHVATTLKVVESRGKSWAESVNLGLNL